MKRFFIAVAVINQLGNWLTFLVIIYHSQLAFGSVGSGLVLLAQSLPALLAARAISDRIPPHHIARGWILIQGSLAVMTVLVSFAYDSLPAVLAYVAVSMLFRAVANPLFYSMVDAAVSQDEKKSTLTGVAAAGSIATVLSPAGGGALAQLLGVQAVMMVDAFTFAAVALCGLAVAQKIPIAAAPAELPPGAPRRWWADLPLPSALVRGPEGIGSVVRSGPLAAWCLLLVTGALLNVMETPYSLDVLKFTSVEFGLLLGCFGAGGLAVFLGSAFSNRAWVSLRTATVLYAAGLGLWLTGLGPLPMLGFVLAGFGTAAAAGELRAALSLWGEKNRVPGQKVWGWANQIILAANFVCCGLVTLAYAYGMPPQLVAAPLTCVFILLFAAESRIGAEQRAEIRETAHETR